MGFTTKPGNSRSETLDKPTRPEYLYSASVLDTVSIDPLHSKSLNSDPRLIGAGEAQMSDMELFRNITVLLFENQIYGVITTSLKWVVSVGKQRKERC